MIKLPTPKAVLLGKFKELGSFLRSGLELVDRLWQIALVIFGVCA